MWYSREECKSKSCPQARPALHFFWQLATPLLHPLSPRHHHGGVAPLRDPGRQAWSFFPCRRSPGLLFFPGCGLGLEYLCLGITAIGGGKNGLWSLHDVCDLYYLLRFSFGTECFARMAAQCSCLVSQTAAQSADVSGHITATGQYLD